MQHKGELPKVSDVQQFAASIPSFPISGQAAAEWAEFLGCERGLIDFFKLFSPKMVFKSRTEFVNYCDLLCSLLYEEDQFTKGPMSWSDA